MKLFVCSDIHSYYNEMIVALRNSGFEKNNPEHMLIVLGDCFDRGLQSRQVLKYLESVENKIVTRGNHETLLLEACERGYPFSYDNDNGTTQTICDLGYFEYDMDFQEACDRTLKRVKPFIDSMVNYYETAHYVFVHSFVPLLIDDNFPSHYTRNRKFRWNPDWRNASDEEWDEARWGNPFELAEEFWQEDKTLIFGHFHCSYPRAIFEGKPEFGLGSDFSIYYGDGYIGIDGCTAYSGTMNILTIEDDFIND